MGYPQVTMVVSVLSHGLSLVTWMIGGTLRGTSIILLRGEKKNTPKQRESGERYSAEDGKS